MKIDCNFTKIFFKELDRMCKSSVSCDRCEIKPIMDKYNRIDCRETIIDHPIDILNVIQKWSDEHQSETRLEHFKKNVSKSPDIGRTPQTLRWEFNWGIFVQR